MKVYRYGDNVDTDVIIPARYLNAPDEKSLASHCMEDIDAQFAGTVEPGDIVVAGANFGCGSSREFAPACIAALGVRCIIAKSFARIFYRNGINNGMFLIETPDVYDLCQEGDELTVVVNREIQVNGRTVPIRPIPDNLFAIIQAGGLVARYRALNEAKERGEG